MQAKEGEAATLRCELNKAASVLWKKSGRLLKSSDKYKMSQKATVVELGINDLQEEDSGSYTCICEDVETTATLTVHGNGKYLLLEASFPNIPSLLCDLCVFTECP